MKFPKIRFKMWSVCQFTDNAPYNLPVKQPVPFYSVSSKEAQIIEEIHKLLCFTEDMTL